MNAPAGPVRPDAQPTLDGVCSKARALRAAGFVPVPVKNDASKRPALEVWTPFKTQPPTDKELRAWFVDKHPHGVGVLCGPASPGLRAFDFDGPEIFDRYVDAALDAGLADVVSRVCNGYLDATPGGGRRVLFRVPADVPFKDDVFAARVGTGKGLTLIEQPTHAVLAPSFGGVHETGQPYVSLCGGVESLATITADEYDALCCLARQFDERPAREAGPRPIRGATTDQSKDRPGDDYNARGSWAELLERHGWRHFRTRGDVQEWTRPGKVRFCSATINATGTNRLHVFSASAAPFQAGESYSLFGAYAHLEHAGDFHAATLALAAQGYGTPATKVSRTKAAKATANVDETYAWVRDAKGLIVPNNLENIRQGLARLGVVLTFDQFQRQACLHGVPLEDADVDRLWVRLDDAFGFRPSKDTLRTVLVTEADASPIHPVRQYLDALAWDGTPRLDRWLVTYAGAADTPYVRAVGALPLIAAVRRVRQPGSKFDELLILEATQGTGKSSGLRALCPREDWFSDDLPLGVDSKLVIERTTGRWLIEAAELHGHRGRETEALKAFLSRQVDGPVRLAYGRLPTTVPRQFILVGTTNARTAYLKDPTGARRFWPVTVGTFDLDALARDRDQLWAEAAAREAAGASIRLDATLWDAATAEQEGRRAADPWEEVLAPLLEGDGITRPDRVAVSAIWDALKMEASHRDNRAADRVAAIVQRHGFTAKGKARVDGQWVRCWVRTGAADAE
ncbi:hypothetical protein TBR22_A32010 [Luteitalea sp. TBR-22]|uniref:VapE domain-containing protein n=1 Tax=Luteitalea sp. TBR-22 TaxID=2802971 RepID=UPI001AF5919A|nr:VapE domain-containing protein [Luteitalea sp. TBR-22]BCS33972.1 hypothetical protein TBR22_A32010 [Luteitalea sp. TBR-22]